MRIWLTKNFTLIWILAGLITLIVAFSAILISALNLYEKSLGSVAQIGSLKLDDVTLTSRAAFGQFGDFIGGIINPMIGFFTAIFVIFSIVVTTVDQARIRFETTFFSLMSELDNLKAATKAADHAGMQHQGSDAFTQICFMKFNFKDTEADLKSIVDIAGVSARYPSFYRMCEEDLGPYFRLIYRILKYVDEAPGGSVWQRNFCAGVLRAKLSKSELWLLTLNALSTYSEGKMKPLIEKYRMLQHLPNTVYGADLSELKKEFDSKTFK